MSLQSKYDECLEDTVCPRCYTQGMEQNGGFFDWICPNCRYEGSLLNDE